MIDIYIDWPTGGQIFTVHTVPRVGETVYIKDLPYRVQAVKHRMADQYSGYGVAVVLEHMP